MDKNIVIRFENITFGYNPAKPVLKNVNFSIYQNTYVCIIGHNGSGKSTTSRLISGLSKPQSGGVYVNEELMNKDNVVRLRKNIGIVFQNPDNQFIGMTVADDIAFGLENNKIPHEQMQPIIDNISKKIGIYDLLNYAPNQLSGGQKQKVAISSVLATDPNIIIFDESTSMLDARSKVEIKKLMFDLKQNFNKTVISITHDMEELLQSDHIIVFEAGHVVFDGKAKELFNNPEIVAKYQLDLPFDLKLNHLLYKKDDNIPIVNNRQELINYLKNKNEDK